MPVTRHPPCRPGRAVFPHPVLRLSSRPRCKAKPSSQHAPTWNLRNTRTRSRDAVEDPGTLLPRVAAPLASPPVEPVERTVHGPMDKAVERAGVPAHAVVVVVAPSARMQPLEACPPRQMPVWFAPFREPVASGVELLAGGAPHDAGPAVPLWGPENRAAQQGAAPLLARVQTAEPAPLGFLWCPLEVAVRQPGGPHSKKPFRVLLHAEGPHPVSRIAAPPGCAPPGWLHHWLTPQVQGIVQRDMGEDGHEWSRDRAHLPDAQRACCTLPLPQRSVSVSPPCACPHCRRPWSPGVGVSTPAGPRDGGLSCERTDV
jgi:hypothetical protein